MERDKDDDDSDVYGLATDTGVVFHDENEAKKYVKFLNDSNVNSDSIYFYVEDEYEKYTTAEKALEKFLKKEINHYISDIEKCSSLSLFKDLSPDAKKYNKNDIIIALKDIKLLLTIFKMRYDKYLDELDKTEVSQFLAEIKLFNIQLLDQNNEPIEIKLNIGIVRQIIKNATYIHDWVCSVKKLLNKTKMNLENLQTIGIVDTDDEEYDEDETDADNPNDSIE